MKIDIIDMIIDYENDDLDTYEVLTLFSILIKEFGVNNMLQGHYGRMTDYLLTNNIIDEYGNVDLDNLY